MKDDQAGDSCSSLSDYEELAQLPTTSKTGMVIEEAQCHLLTLYTIYLLRKGAIHK